MAVPWDLIGSGLAEDDLADPRRLAEVRTAYEPHAVLGLESGATAEAVRSAFRRLALQHHPDRGGDLKQFQRLQAAHDALVGVGADGGSILPYGCSQCPSRGGGSASRRDVVRCILVAPWGWLTLDEKQVLAVTADERRVCAEAPADASLLCCCLLDKGRRLAIGGTRGHVAVVAAAAPAAPAAPEIVPLGTSAPILAACAPAGDQSPYLFVSADGEVLLLDLDERCVLCSLDLRLAPLLRAEALLCPSVPALEDADAFPPEPLLLAAGADAATAAAAAGAGRLALLRVRAPCADGEAEGAELVWHAARELPVYALAAQRADAGGAAGGGDAAAGGAAPTAAPTAAPLLFAAAAGSVVTLHDAATGGALRRLSAGRDGVLYALAFSPRGDALLAAGSEEVVHAFRVPGGTRRAVMRLTRSGWSGGSSLNTATVNALAFVDAVGGFLSGGYDCAITRWQLEPPPPTGEAEGAAGLEALATLSVGELHGLVRRAGLSAARCLERRELETLAARARRRLAGADAGLEQVE